MSLFVKKGNKQYTKECVSDKVSKIEDVNKLYPYKQRWLQDDDTDTGVSSELCKSYTYGPVHSTPTDSKKLTSQSIGTTDESLAIAKELDFHAKSSEDIKDTSEGIENCGKSGCEENLNASVAPGIIIQNYACQKEKRIDVIDKPSHPMKETDSSLPVQLPGPDTLEEMADKQKFFSELKRGDMSDTLDYGLLIRQLSKTGSHLALSSAECNPQDNMKPQITGVNVKNNGEHMKPLQQQTSLLSKVMLLDSMGSSLNTTGTSVPAENISPALTKEAFDKIENQVFYQNNNEGTVTNEEMNDLHNALHDIDLSSTLAAIETVTLPNGIAQVIKPGDSLQQSHNSVHLENNSKEQSENNGIKGNQVDESLAKEPEITELNQKYPFAKSPSDHSAVHMYGFDLTPVVTSNNEPAVSVPVSLEPKYTSPDQSCPGTNPSKTVSVSKKTSKYSNISSSGYGVKGVQVQKPKTKPTTNCSRISGVTKTSRKNQVTPIKSKRESEKTDERCSRFLNDSVPHEVNVKRSLEADSTDDVHLVVNSLNKQLKEERDRILKLKAKIIDNEEKYKQSIKMLNQQFQREVEDLKKANYILTTKVSATNDKNLNELESHLEKELEEHKRLLAAYDAENKRLYNDAKQQKVLQKQSEERMFSENQKLLRELNSLQNQLNLKQSSHTRSTPKVTTPPPLPLSSLPDVTCNKEIVSSNNKNNNNNINCEEIITKSLVPMSPGQNKEEINKLRLQCSLLQQTNFELETQVNKLVEQKKDMHQVLEDIKKAKDEEMKAVECRFFNDIESMKKKIQWYTYNQQLLDQSVSVLKQKDKDIEQLNLRIQKLSSDTGKRFEENKLLDKERAANQKRIQNLQHQIKEMERIYCKRNPNSLPALLMAVGCSSDKDRDGHQSASPLTEMLEQKVQKLENQLQKAQDEGDLKLRTVEQKYNKLKLQYEEQIETLEESVKKLRQQVILGRCTSCKKITLPNGKQEMLETTKDNSDTKVQDLLQNIDQLQKEVVKYKQQEQQHEQEQQPKDDNLQAQQQRNQNREVQLQKKVQLLQQQLDSSNNQVATLRCMFSKLQTEKQTLLKQNLVKRPSSTNEEWNKKSSKILSKSKKNNNVFETQNLLQKEKKEKAKQILSEIEIPENILKENETLKVKVDQLQLCIEQQKVEWLKCSAESGAEIRKLHEHHQDEINVLRVSHQKELCKILTEQTLKNSASNVVQLQCKVDAQQVLVSHLQEQLANAQVDAEEMSSLKVNQVLLESRIQHLQNELEEAKSTHSPKRQHFQNLVVKIHELEKKQDAREKEMANVMKKSSCLSLRDLEKEVEKWKKVANSKNADIEKYRVELDSIISILTSIKQNGMLPNTNSKFMEAAMLYR
ncbi:centrosomal protein of 162 kDa-like [Argonauta hians]